MSAQILEHVIPAPCTNVLDTKCTPSQSLESMSVVNCELLCKISHIINYDCMLNPEERYEETSPNRKHTARTAPSPLVF